MGVIAGVWLFGRRLEERGVGTQEDAGSIAIWAVLAGVVGARLYHVATDWDRFANNSPEVARVVADACTAGEHDVIVVNFANGDMVGHTGVFEAAVKAIRTLDRLLSEIMPPSLAAGTIWLVTADHGNCDEMLTPDGKVLTQHSLNRVPFLVCGKEFEGRSGVLRDGEMGLSDIAPTVLKLLGMEQPREMTGTSIVR